MEAQEKFPISKVLMALLSLAVLVLAQAAAAAFGSLVLLVTHLPALGNAAAGVLYPALAMLGFWALCRFGLREPLSAWRIGPVRLKPVWCVTAFLMPALVCGVYLLLPGQWAEAADRMDTMSILAVGVLYVGIGTGIVEEAVFRGFIMTALERRWRWFFSAKGRKKAFSKKPEASGRSCDPDASDFFIEPFFERVYIVSRCRPIGPGGNTTKNAPQPKPRNALIPSPPGRATLFRFRRKNRQAAVYLTDPLWEASQ